MKKEDFLPSSPGTLLPLVGGGLAFRPHPLPPEVRWDVALVRAHGDARAEVGRLEAAFPTDMDPYLLTQPLVRREAFCSSRMEGTHTTPVKMTLFDLEPEEEEPAGSSQREQTREVLNYVRAMEHGLVTLRDGRLPLCNRLFKELHGILLGDVGGRPGRRGEFRVTQNWIGRRVDGIRGARFVPPPPAEMEEGMANLERFLHSGVDTDAELPPFVAIALVHYQFETLHPFEDGNGRIGRLLIPLILAEKGLLRVPALHLSPAMERNREEYVDRMLRVSQRGEWNEWIRFFLRMIEGSARETLDRVQLLGRLRDDYRDRVQTRRASALLPRLIDGLFRNPSLTIGIAAKTLEVTPSQAAIHLRRLEKLGILREVSGRDRNLVFLADEILRATFD